MPPPAKRRAPEAQPEEPASQVTQVDVLAEELPHVEQDPRFNVFSKLPISVDVTGRRMIEYAPVTSTDNQWVFDIPPASDFMDIGGATLVFKLEVTKADGTSPAAADVFGTINNMSASVFKQIKMDVSNETLTTTSEHVGTASYMTTLAFEDTSNIGNRSQTGFVLDTPFHLNTIGAANIGLIARRKFFENPAEPWPRTGTATSDHVYSGKSTFYLRLHDVVDFCNNPRFAIPGLPIQLTCIKQDDKFFMMAADGGEAYKFKILNLKLQLTHFQAVPSKMQAITDVLFSNNRAANYPIQTRINRSYIIPAGQSQYTKYNLFDNNTPNVVLFGMVLTSAFQGAYHLNPYKFDTFGLNSVRLLKGSEEVAGPRLIIDPLNDYAELVDELSKATNSGRVSNTKLIQRDNFRGGYAIWGYCLNPDGQYKPWEETTGINTGASGITLELQFSTNLGANVTLFCVGFDENNVIIDGGRNVTLENQF